MGSFARTLTDVVYGSFVSAVGSTVANALGNLLIQVGLNPAPSSCYCPPPPKILEAMQGGSVSLATQRHKEQLVPVPCL